MPARAWGSGSYADITLDLTRGDDWSYPFRQIDQTTGAVLDLDGRTWAFAVSAVDGTAEATGTVTEDPAGTLVIGLTAAQTAALEGPQFAWALKETHQGSTSTIAAGRLWVADDPTP